MPQVSLLDRLARALAPYIATPPVHFIALLGLCAAYIQGGLDKLLDFNAAIAEVQHFGLPFATATAGATIVTSTWDFGITGSATTAQSPRASHRERIRRGRRLCARR
jgi:hypothetical protein